MKLDAGNRRKVPRQSLRLVGVEDLELNIQIFSQSDHGINTIRMLQVVFDVPSLASDGKLSEPSSYFFSSLIYGAIGCVPCPKILSSSSLFRLAQYSRNESQHLARVLALP
jgi:hypothetical protein